MIRRVGKRVLVQADSLRKYAGAAGESQTHEEMTTSEASREQILTQQLNSKVALVSG